MKKSLLLLFLLATLLLASGCGNTQDKKPEATLPIKEPTSIKTDKKTDVITEEFSIIAKQWEFEPSTITVNKGANVKLKIKNIDVKHGIAIPEFNVNVDLPPNQETIVEFIADQSGTFTFSCSVLCGSGHRGMKGTLIVK